MVSSPSSSSLDSPASVRPGEELDRARLRSYLVSTLGDEPSEFPIIEQFPRGFSNLTYLVRWGSRELVLRRPPFGADIKTAHDMGREHTILSRLSPVYAKAPAPVAHCTDESVLGAPFYLMERVKGVILRPGMTAGEAPPPGRMAAIAQEAIETLIELHRVDFRAAGLGELGRPEGYVRRQIEGWIGRYERAKTDEIAEMSEVGRWLVERLGSVEEARATEAALIHNDYKYDNLVLDPSAGCRIVAVLDWEMATLGEPLMDLGTTLGYWVEPDDPPELRALELSPTTLPGNPTRVEIADSYAAGCGRDLGDVVFFYVYGLYKIGVIVQQIYSRYKRGATTDARFANLIDGVRGCALTAAQAARKGKMDRLFEA